MKYLLCLLLLCNFAFGGYESTPDSSTVISQIQSFIEGAVCMYSSSTAVEITDGQVEVNGSFVDYSSATHTMTSLAADEDFHYIYIDSSGTITDATTEPTESNGGWYSDSKRCIGAVFSPAASATISEFETAGTGRDVKVYVGTIYKQMASSMTPTGAWLTPDDADGSAVTPVNANGLFLYLANSDTGSNATVAATSAEHAGASSNNYNNPMIHFRSQEQITIEAWMDLGATRNIKISGDSDDNTSLTAYASGYQIQR